MNRFRLAGRSVKVWKRGGHWIVAVDGKVVAGRHMTEAQAAGAGLLEVLCTEPAHPGARAGPGSPARRPAGRIDGSRHA